MRLYAPHSQSGHFGEEKYLALTGVQKAGLPSP